MNQVMIHFISLALKAETIKYYFVTTDCNFLYLTIYNEQQSTDIADDK